MPSENDGTMVILSSPSGAGKTTLVSLLAKQNNFEISISMAKTAILMANTNKAPGLDQINANFFKVMLKGGKGDEVFQKR